MARLFVGWFRDNPDLKELTYCPELYDCSEPASLSDAIKLTNNMDCFKTSEPIELKEGIYCPSVVAKRNARGETWLVLCLQEAATGESFRIFHQEVY